MNIQHMMKNDFIRRMVVPGVNFSFDFKLHHLQTSALIRVFADENFRLRSLRLKVTRAARHVITEGFANVGDGSFFEIFFGNNEPLEPAVRFDISIEDHFFHCGFLPLSERRKYNTRNQAGKAAGRLWRKGFRPTRNG